MNEKGPVALEVDEEFDIFADSNIFEGVQSSTDLSSEQINMAIEYHGGQLYQYGPYIGTVAGAINGGCPAIRAALLDGGLTALNDILRGCEATDKEAEALQHSPEEEPKMGEEQGKSEPDDSAQVPKDLIEKNQEVLTPVRDVVVRTQQVAAQEPDAVMYPLEEATTPLLFMADEIEIMINEKTDEAADSNSRHTAIIESSEAHAAPAIIHDDARSIQPDGFADIAPEAKPTVESGLASEFANYSELSENSMPLHTQEGTAIEMTYVSELEQRPAVFKDATTQAVVLYGEIEAPESHEVHMDGQKSIKAIERSTEQDNRFFDDAEVFEDEGTELPLSVVHDDQSEQANYMTKEESFEARELQRRDEQPVTLTQQVFEHGIEIIETPDVVNAVAVTEVEATSDVVSQMLDVEPTYEIEITTAEQIERIVSIERTFLALESATTEAECRKQLMELSKSLEELLDAMGFENSHDIVQQLIHDIKLLSRFIAALMRVATQQEASRQSMMTYLPPRHHWFGQRVVERVVQTMAAQLQAA